MSKRPQKAGISDALRSAVERTYSATAGPAAETRERAQELLDDLVGRAEKLMARRGEQLTRAGREELSKLEDEIAQIRKRLGDLESSLRRRGR